MKLISKLSIIFLGITLLTSCVGGDAKVKEDLEMVKADLAKLKEDYAKLREDHNKLVKDAIKAEVKKEDALEGSAVDGE